MLDGDEPTPIMTTARRPGRRTNGRTATTEHWAAWVQALGAVFAILLAAPALFISLDTLRDQQRINEQTGINLGLERDRYRKRYASRVSWWKVQQDWWERDTKTRSLWLLRDKPLGAMIQNRSTVPITNVQIAFAGTEAGIPRSDPFTVRIERNCPRSGGVVDHYLCTETELLKIVMGNDARGWKWFSIGDIPPCTTIEVVSADEYSDKPQGFVPAKIIFSDPDERWVKDDRNPVRSLKIVNRSEYSGDVNDGQMLPTSRGVHTTTKGEASDCTDQT